MKLSRFPDKEFDLVLVFGPMYHLYSMEDKVKALTEARRVLKDDGVILVAYCMNDNFRVQPKPEDLYDYVRLEDMDAYNKAAGLERIKVISADGPSDYMRPVLNAMDEETFETFIRYHLSVCERPELVGAGSHTVDILKKSII